ncbi:Wzz/FepE/Etk N-terminal domain-containing protein [Bacillus sp. WLY-B-L8]|nr:Wzz/FepE/Etk N-terminal domain-containing protein [Bacillus sp. WLY-B-L8]
MGFLKEIMDIRELRGILRKRIFTICITSCFIVAFVMGTTTYVLKPVYQYSIQVLIGNLDQFNKENGVNKTQENKQLVTSYVDIIKSPLIIAAVKKELGLKRSSYELAKQISVMNTDNSQIITVTTKDSNPKLVKEITNSLANQSQERFKQYTNFEGVKILSDTVVNEEVEKLFPKYMFILPISIIIGIFIGITLAILREYFDDKIYNEYDLENGTDLLFLGYICTKQKKYRQNNVHEKNSIYRGESVDV